MIKLARWGAISSIPGVYRDSDRQAFVIRTHRGVRRVRHNDVVVKFGGYVRVIKLSRLVGTRSYQ